MDTEIEPDDVIDEDRSQHHEDKKWLTPCIKQEAYGQQNNISLSTDDIENDCQRQECEEEYWLAKQHYPDPAIDVSTTECRLITRNSKSGSIDHLQ